MSQPAAPNTGIEVFDERMRDVVDVVADFHLVGEGYRFTEGPCWWPEAGCLVFSDIPSDTIHRWTPAGGVTVFRKPSHRANGNTVDREGRLVTCEHGSRTVTRTDVAGTVETLCATYGGKRLNSPNDAVVKGDGTLWFTDPPYGIKPEASEQAANHVFRLDPGAEEPVSVWSEMSRPNGLCFSPDQRLLYIADSDTELHLVRRFAVADDNTLSGGEVFATIDRGVPDGMRCDVDGRLYSTAGDGVRVFDPDGTLLGRILTPETAANCTFGGDGNQTLFITATSRVWRLELEVAGA